MFFIQYKNFLSFLHGFSAETSKDILNENIRVFVYHRNVALADRHYVNITPKHLDFHLKSMHFEAKEMTNLREDWNFKCVSIYKLS